MQETLQKTNYQLITEGFQLLRDAAAPFITKVLVATYGEDAWWHRGIWEKFSEHQRLYLPESGSMSELTNSLDVACCLRAIDFNWREVFSKSMTRDCRTWVIELKGTRNKWAHFGATPPSARDTRRALDTMSRLSEAMDPSVASNIDELLGSVAPDHNPTRATNEVRTEATAPETPVPSAQQRTDPRLLSTPPSARPKSDWSIDSICSVAEEWCQNHDRQLSTDLSAMDLEGAADAVLEMPSVSAEDALSFREAASNLYFRLSDFKMSKLTTALFEDEEQLPVDSHTMLETQASSESVAPEELSDIVTGESTVEVPTVPTASSTAKHTLSWTKDEISNEVASWCAANGRVLTPEFEKWSLRTLRAVCLSRANEQSNAVCEGSGTSEDHLYQLDDTKLFIITHS